MLNNGSKQSINNELTNDDLQQRVCPEELGNVYANFSRIIFYYKYVTLIYQNIIIRANHLGLRYGIELQRCSSHRGHIAQSPLLGWTCVTDHVY